MSTCFFYAEHRGANEAVLISALDQFLFPKPLELCSQYQSTFEKKLEFTAGPQSRTDQLTFTRGSLSDWSESLKRRTIKRLPPANFLDSP